MLMRGVKRWRRSQRGSFLYCVLTIFAFQLVILAFLYWNLSSKGGQGDDRQVGTVHGQLQGRTPRTVLLASEKGGENYSDPQQPNFAFHSHTRAKQEVKHSSVRSTVSPISQAISSPDSVPASSHNSLSKVAAVHAPSDAMNKTLISPERWKRLKPPSMLLDARDGGTKLALAAERQSMWHKEQQRRVQVLEEEQEQRDAFMEDNKMAGKQVKSMAIEQAESSKLNKPLKEKLRNSKDMKYQRIRKPNGKNLEKKGSPSDVNATAKLEEATKDKNKETRREILHQQTLEQERMQKLNKLWKERKEQLSNRLGNTKLQDPVPTLQDYLTEMCQEALGPLVECYTSPLRNLSESEARGDDIMFTVRTTAKYHDTRLPVLFDTWLSEMEPSNIFVVTDGEDDEDLIWKTNTLGKCITLCSMQACSRSPCYKTDNEMLAWP